jgi:hypothetical protein
MEEAISRRAVPAGNLFCDPSGKVITTSDIFVYNLNFLSLSPCKYTKIEPAEAPV